MDVHFFEYPLAQIMPLNQMTELAQRRLVRRCPAAKTEVVREI
jgi:hypothetical protein